ncbi:unnamed protein product (macronuclear) [Paramecium tetraurelia]|uniref:Uncharacterized protein n=1 Tax=Paramecium tetraurelia TaxID=5888 RepID=A0BEG9_PARTE|nr:uncharacterized protein GSPATT00027969001 [Paramecium tetraurelia]CAK56936.1 unnamed protein product [Paramecium tetraurelia]|eukprot:XP_001424334.1 hypothetical protein (macronuclear) [Paramecium tetraurelia strain d4-2]
MSIHSIQEKQSKQAIYITYKLDKVDCLVQFELMSKQVNFLNFSQSYLRLETPFKHFGIEYQESGYITTAIFIQILNQAQKNPIKGASDDVINQLIDDFETIEEDLNLRLVYLFKLSNNPEFSDEKVIKENDRLLMNKIRDIDQSVSDNYKYRDEKWQLLYVVETTAKIIWNGEEKKLIKLGKTNKSIEKYVIKLKQQYQGKIEFRPLFAQRLYTPANNLVDRIFFHKKLLKSIPESKVYLKAEENKHSQIHYEFYFLTDEFVTNFEKCLRKFIDKNEEQYQSDKVINTDAKKTDASNSMQDITQNENQDLQNSDQQAFIKQQQDQEQAAEKTQIEITQDLNQQQEQKESSEQQQKESSEQQQQLLEQQKESSGQQQELSKQSQQEQAQQQDQSQEQLNLILQQINQNEELNEQTLNEQFEISNSLDDTSYEFFDGNPKTNPSIFGVPVNYELSEESQEILYQGSKVINLQNNFLKALLYTAAAKRELKQNDK